MNISGHKKTARSSIFWLLLAVASLWTPAASAQTCNAQTHDSNNFFYSHWSNFAGGPPCPQFDSRWAGNYYYSWSNLQMGVTRNPYTGQLDKGNFVGGKGWQVGRLDRIIGYHVGAFNTQHNGRESNAFLAFYGWGKDNSNVSVEYYVVETWGSWIPPVKTGAVYGGQIQADGGTYDLWKTYRDDQPSAYVGTDQVEDFVQYWSVRTQKRAINTNSRITLGEHVKGWREKLGSLKDENQKYQVMGTEVNSEPDYPASGYASVTVWHEGFFTPVGSSPPGYTYTVRARGTTATEQITLTINGTVIKTWPLWSTDMQDYTVTSAVSPAGGLMVNFINDASSPDRNVQIDYLQVNGQIRQAEHMSHNTGVWANYRCGGAGYSEWLNCNGGIGFGF